MPKRKTAPNPPSRSSPGSSSRISSSSAPSRPCSFATVGNEAELWRWADAFEEQHARLVVEQAEGVDPDEYLVPPEDEVRGEKLMFLSIGHCR